MAVKVLGISSSPRPAGNSDLLLKRALEGAENANAQTQYIRLADYKIAPCIECDHCYKTGECQIEDDFQLLLKKTLDTDRLIFATPIFFMNVCAQAKSFIDRCQCLWARKTILKKTIKGMNKQHQPAMLIAVGGSKSKKMFESVQLTMKSFFDVLEMQYRAGLLINKIDRLGEVKKHPDALKEAFRLGRELVSIKPSKNIEPVDIKLTYST